MDNYQYKLNGITYNVEIEEIVGNIAKVNVNGKSFEVEMKEPLKAKPKAPHVTPVAAPSAPAFMPSQPAAPAAPAASAGPGKKVVAPLPGTITELKVTVGQTVKTGDTVLVLEAMKMQNNIEAEADGTITKILVNQGDTVMEGATLVVIG
jgi:biotin carboxyl carrier protein